MNSILLYILYLVGCCYMIKLSTDYLGDAIEDFAIRYKIHPSIRGAFFDSASSSTPEVITSITAAIQVLGLFGSTPNEMAFADVGVGTIGGSAIFNILVIPFVSILFCKNINTINIDKKQMLRDIIFYVCSVGILFIATYIGNLNRTVGIIMTLLYIIYLGYLKISSNNMTYEHQEKEDLLSIGKIILYTIGSLIGIFIFVHFTVVYSIKLGECLGVNTLIMSLVVIAAVTSLPDTLLSVKSAKRGELDASISNAVGSNIFDILIGLGFILAIFGLSVPASLSETGFVFVFLLISSLTYTMVFIFNTSKLTKLISLALAYIAFISYIIYII